MDTAGSYPGVEGLDCAGEQQRDEAGKAVQLEHVLGRLPGTGRLGSVDCAQPAPSPGYA